MMEWWLGVGKNSGGLFVVIIAVIVILVSFI